MKWNWIDGADERVVEISEFWCNLDNISDFFPQRAGVYVFVDDAQAVKYVGKAGPKRLKIEAQDALSRCKGTGATKAFWLATNSEDVAEAVERDLIDQYDPPNNDVALECSD
jgi:excinuclease UvrABC nuclease subunit